MDELKRVTAYAPELTSTLDEMPRVGQTVLALSIGGRLIEMCWQADSPSFYVAWMPFPKLTAKIRQQLLDRYLGTS